jgi:hypothetical protein
MEISVALREFQDYAQDVIQARYQTFENNLQRVLSLLEPGTPLGAAAKPDGMRMEHSGCLL